MILQPQPGPQTEFLNTPADIAIYGGAAGGGKTHALLMEPLRHYDNPDFSAVIFRRNITHISMDGGLWDESSLMYAPFGTRPVQSPRHRHFFPSGMCVTFAHLDHEKNKLDWQGAQIPLICFDELTHFTETQFFYMISRLRSVSGVPGYVRATTNPDNESWVRRMLDWWIDGDGFPIPSRSGKMRYMARIGDDLVWGSSRKKLIEDHMLDADQVMSITFIPARLEDNQILMQKDPSYRTKLLILPKLERERLLSGNWNIKRGGDIIQEEWFQIVNTWPKDAKIIRFWDLAGTDPTKAKARRKKASSDPDYTAGALLAEHEGIFYICDMRRFRLSPKGVEDKIKHAAQVDGKSVPVRMWQDPAQAGVAQIDHYGRNVLKGMDFMGVSIPGRLDQIVGPLASAIERGCVKVVQGLWNRNFFNEMEGLWDGHDDQLSALIGAFLELTLDEDDVIVYGAGSRSYDDGSEDDNDGEKFIDNVNDDAFWD